MSVPRVSSRVPPPNTIAQMQEALRDEWEAIPQQDIKRLVHSMRRRLTALIQANGGNTRYWLCSVIRKLPGIHYFYCSCVFATDVWWIIAVLWLINIITSLIKIWIEYLRFVFVQYISERSNKLLTPHRIDRSLDAHNNTSQTAAESDIENNIELRIIKEVGHTFKNI